MSLDEEFEIVPVARGARSLRSRRNGEVFHPVVGPMAEARSLHAAQQRLAERAALIGNEALIIWDVGLGAAANALAAVESARTIHGPVELHSFDLSEAPLRFALQHVDELEYLRGFEAPLDHLLSTGTAKLDGVTWQLHLGNFADCVNNPGIPGPHAVLFDPYSPASNPDLWNVEIFGAIRRRVAEDADCILTSYSRSTAVRTTMLVAGWWVGRGRATGEKSETTIAATHPRWLETPLDRQWLERLRRSTAPGPWRSSGLPSPGNGAVIAQELERTHPQFR